MQPEAIHWDVAQLAGVLSLVTVREPYETLLNAWGERFQEALVAGLVRRLGIASGSNDLELASAILAGLRSKAVTIDRFFFDWRGGRVPGDAVYGAAFDPLRAALVGRAALPGALDHPYWSDAGPCSMAIDEVEAIWARIAEEDDWSDFEAKIAAIRRMGEAHAV